MSFFRKILDSLGFLILVLCDFLEFIAFLVFHVLLGSLQKLVFLPGDMPCGATIFSFEESESDVHPWVARFMQHFACYFHILRSGTIGAWHNIDMCRVEWCCLTDQEDHFHDRSGECVFVGLDNIRRILGRHPESVFAEKWIFRGV
jgi:hypothetical protein